MSMIDPRRRKAARKESGQSETPELGESAKRVSRECKIPGCVVGWEHFKSSQKGTPGLMVRFVALEGPDAGATTERNFWLTDRAMDQFLDFLLALGHEEPLDPYNDDHLEAAFSRGAVMMDIKGEDYTDRRGNDRTSYRPAWFGVYKGRDKAEWNKLLEEATKGWAAYVKWREQNPRPQPGSGGGGGGSYADSSSGGSGDYSDDSIPF